LTGLIRGSANVKDYKDFYKHFSFIEKKFSGGFERDRIKNRRSLFEKGRFVYRLREKRDSCVRKLKVPIVSENNSENKIKPLKAANFA